MLIKTYAKQWNLFTLFSNHLKKLFDYLARNFLKNKHEKGTLLSNALKLLKDAFSTIKDPLYNAILNQITRDRNNEIIDIDSLKVAVSTFVLMGYDKPDIVKQEPSGVLEWKGQLTN
jgi:hypothetical protein